MRTRNSNFPNNPNVTIPRRQNRGRAPNVVEPELRTIIAPMAERTMEELLRAPTEGYGEAIVLPEINADHFEIKTNLLQLVQANPFHGLENENPHAHINSFKRITSTLRFRNVPNDVIKLMMFPYSLEGAAKTWNGKTVRLEHLCLTSMKDMPPRRRFILTAPPPGCDVAESSAADARAPRGQYDFVDDVEAGKGLIRSPGHDAQTIARVADRAEDVGYVRALQASEHRMMTSIEEVNLRVSYQAQVCRQESEDFYTQLHDDRTDRRDIRLEIDVVRGQMTAYEIELHEVRQAYLSSEALHRALLARLETLETHMSHMEWQRQRAEDDAVRQIMRTRSIKLNGLRRPVQPARVCSYTDFMNATLDLQGNFEKVDKYISGLPDNINGNVMSARPKTLDDAIELANDLMDQKLHTYAKRQNENKRKTD
ncbi:hypothetical protein Tco_0138477 [Tanacetum coccineum]